MNHKVKQLFFLMLVFALNGCEKEDNDLIQQSHLTVASIPNVNVSKLYFEDNSALSISGEFTRNESSAIKHPDWDNSLSKFFKQENNLLVNVLYTPIYLDTRRNTKAFIGSTIVQGELTQKILILDYSPEYRFNSFAGHVFIYSVDGELEILSKYENNMLVENYDINLLKENASSSLTSRTTDCSELPDVTIIEEFEEWLRDCEDQMLDQIDMEGPGASDNTIEQGDSPGGGSTTCCLDIWGAPSTAIEPEDPDPDSSSGGSNIGGGLPSIFAANSITPEGPAIARALEIDVDSALQEAEDWLNNEATKRLLEALADFLNANKDNSNVNTTRIADVPENQLPEITEDAKESAISIIIYMSNGGREDCSIAALSGSLQPPDGCGTVIEDEDSPCPNGKIRLGSLCLCPGGKVENENGECELDCNTFEERVEDVLDTEAGFVDDPADPGGATNRGISWPVWLENARSVLNVSPTLDNLRALNREQAAKIYKEKYWNPIYADNIVDGDLRWLLFDFYVNAKGGAVKTLQRTLNELGASVSVDGAMGPNTLATLNGFGDKSLLYNTFKINRQKFYDDLTKKSVDRYLARYPNATEAELLKNTHKNHINGWTNRVNEFKDKTLENYISVNCE
jgi:lysozyme family protein